MAVCIFDLAVYSPDTPVIFIGDSPCVTQLELTYSASLTIDELMERPPWMFLCFLSVARMNSVDYMLYRLRIVATEGYLPLSVRRGEESPFARTPLNFFTLAAFVP